MFQNILKIKLVKSVKNMKNAKTQFKLLILLILQMENQLLIKNTNFTYLPGMT